jgi:hypothetical protein
MYWIGCREGCSQAGLCGGCANGAEGSEYAVGAEVRGVVEECAECQVRCAHREEGIERQRRNIAGLRQQGLGREWCWRTWGKMSGARLMSLGWVRGGLVMWAKM